MATWRRTSRLTCHFRFCSAFSLGQNTPLKLWLRAQNVLLQRAGHTESFDQIRDASKGIQPRGLFGANSTWKRNMSFFSQHQADQQSAQGGRAEHSLAAMQLALQEVDGA